MSKYRVPFVDPKRNYARLKPEIDAAVTDCLSRGDLIDRQDLSRFEERFAAFVGTKYAVGVNSGYHALQFSLQAAGIGHGDEVVTVAHTFVATISAIVNVGATPILVDVGDDFNMDPAAFESAITPRTRAVIPVSLNGRACDVPSIFAIASRHDLLVIEDAAQALGATFNGRRAGAFGLSGCFSFFPFKVLGCLGDGGAVTTDDPVIAETVKRLRYNGEDRKTGEYHFHGQTALLDNVQAAVLNVKLNYLEEWIAHRRRIASLYRQHLNDLLEARLPHFNESNQFDVFQNYVIRVKDRDGLRDHLESAGIETLIHWPKPVYRHRALRLTVPCLPNTESLCKEVLSLPMSAETTEQHVEAVVESIRSYYVSMRARSVASRVNAARA